MLGVWIRLSETKMKSYRLNADLIKRIEEYCLKKDPAYTETDFIQDASYHFLSCDRDPQTSWKLIPLKYPAKCLIHPEETIEANHWAFFAKGIGVICLDGFTEKYGDKATIKQLLKNRHLDRINKLLEVEIDQKAGKLEDLNEIELTQKIHDLLCELSKINNDYYKRAIGTPEENKVAEQLIELTTKMFEAVEDWRQYILGKRAKKKVSSQIEV
jgi:hypothetical protein